jgi:hypothetical protein
MQSFGISRVDARIFEARSSGVSRTDCRLEKLAGVRDPAMQVLVEDGLYGKQELS